MMRLRSVLILLALTAFIVACGGSGGGSKDDTKDTIEETTPDTADVQKDDTEPGDIEKEEDTGCPGECCDDGACDDGNACTDDRCEANACVNEAVAESFCDDGNACTTDSCDPAVGCQHEDIAGCCVPGTATELLALDFEDDAQLDELSIEDFGDPNEHTATWQLSSLKYHSPSQSLYFGIQDLGSYDNGAHVGSRFTTAALPLPGGNLASLTFWVWLDVEPQTGWDEFNISALIGDERVSLFIKNSGLIDQQWHEVVLDLSAFAGNDLRIEFQFDSLDGSNNNFNGVYVDDLVVASLCEKIDCETVAGCDDGLACTNGACEDGGCVFEWSGDCCLNALDCLDGDACTVDLCVNAACQWSPSANPLCCNADEDCEDDDICTHDACVDNLCEHTPSGEPSCCETDVDCDDGDPCTDDSCDDGSCVTVNICCETDSECDDGDDVCTVDACVEGTCVYTPTGADGCCEPEILNIDFDAGDLAGFAVENSDPAVGWQVFGAEGASSSPTPALYYGDPIDPADLNYNNGDINGGTATLPVFFGEVHNGLAFTFDLFMDTESSANYDKLTVEIIHEGTVYRVWDKTSLESTGVWVSYEVDLSAFAGWAADLVFSFDTVDNTINDGEGVYVDNIALISTCADHACEASDDCNDGLAVTMESCVDGLCVYEFNDEPCDYNSDCDDDDVCTGDVCSGGYCVHAPITECCMEDVECDDGNACTDDSCYIGYSTNQCEHLWVEGCCLTTEDCEDGNSCTVDSCTGEGETCLNEWIDGCCNTNLDCDDDDVATYDYCTAGGCIHKPAGCTEPTDCADADPCTDDVCQDGACYFLPVMSDSCCDGTLLSVGFDDGETGTLTLVNSHDDVKWQVSDVNANSAPYALYYGDPETANYDNGEWNYGSILSELMFLPENAGVNLSFAAYLDVESAVFFDPFEVILHTDLGEIVVWDKAEVEAQQVWAGYDVDLSAYAGQALRVEFRFDTEDETWNTGQGVFVDDILLTTTCNPVGCTEDSDCESFDACSKGTCFDGMCLFAPAADCCHDDGECDDGNACTENVCPFEGSPCDFVWIPECCLEDAHCEDANPCTVDECLVEGEACSHTWTEGCCMVNTDCDDLDAATKDLCVDGACVYKPAECETDAGCEDNDDCTSDHCVDGACAFLGVDSDECCEPDLFEADFDAGSPAPFTVIASPDAEARWQVSDMRKVSAPSSLYFGIAGEVTPDCDDGYDFTDGDAWTAEGCMGAIAAPPAIFHINEVSIISPDLYWDFGSGPTVVNDMISAFATARLADPEMDGMAAAFSTLTFGYPDVKLRFGDASCTYEDDALTACNINATGSWAQFDDVMLETTGTCGEGAEAPCFATPHGAFDIAEVFPYLFEGLDIDTTVTGSTYGSFSGANLSTVGNGKAEMFVPKSLAENLTPSENPFDTEVTVIDILSTDDMVTIDGVEGWMVTMAFSGSAVPYLDAGGCTADPSQCMVDDPCLIGSCDYTSGACVTMPTPDGFACDDGVDGTVNDQCVAGACEGFFVAEPGVFRVNEVTFESPTISYDFGAGATEINAILSAFMTASLDERFPLGGLVTVHDPLAFDSAPGRLLFGEGLCEFDDQGVATACTISPDGSHAQFDDVTYMEETSCGDGIGGPCFLTPDQSFDMGLIVPDVFGADLPPVLGHAMGSFTGNPIANIGVGVIEGFLPTILIGTMDFEFEGEWHNLGAMIAAEEETVVDGVPGYWVRLSFTAVRTPFLAPEEGCAGDIALCDDNDINTLDVCQATSNTCHNLPLATVPPSGDFDTGDAVEGSAMSAPIALPATELALSFALYLDVEQAAGRDPLEVIVHGDQGPMVVWDKAALVPADYFTWTSQMVDLTPFGGQSVRIEFHFDSEDAAVNGGEGVYIDDVRITTTCAPLGCDAAEDCPVLDMCTPAACLDGACAYKVMPNCCIESADCDDDNLCTDDTCVDNACVFDWEDPTCCTVDADCSTGNPCLTGLCEENACAYEYDEACVSPLPFVETFDGSDELAPIGWSTLNQDSATETNWGITTWSAGSMNDHLKFSYSPIVPNYEHWVISPLLGVAAGQEVTFAWKGWFDGYSAAEYETILSARVTADDGATWETVWTETIVDVDIDELGYAIDVSTIVAGSDQVRVAFVIGGTDSNDIMAWHIDDVRMVTGKPPTIGEILEQEAMVGETNEAMFTVTDPDDDPITVTLGEDTPAFVTLTDQGAGTYLLAFTPTIDDVGMHFIDVLATDGQFEVTTSFKLVVSASGILYAEDFDAFDSGVDALLEAGWDVQFGANEEDGTHWEVTTYGDIDDSPAARFNWSPGVENYDEWGVSPEFNASTAAGEPIVFMFDHFLDVYASTDITLSAHVSTDGGTTWTEVWLLESLESSADVGPETINLSVGDLIAGESSVRLAWRIQGLDTYDMNDWQVDNIKVLVGAAPEIDAIEAQTAFIGQQTDIVVHATDSDGDDLIFSLVDAPEFMSIEALSADAAVIHANPEAADWGTYMIKVAVTDEVFNVSTSFDLTVQNEGEVLLLAEDFSAAEDFATLGWTPVNVSGEGDTNWTYYTSSWNDDAYAKFGYSPVVLDFEHRLELPAMDVSGLSGLTLNFYQDFSSYTSKDATPPVTIHVLVSTDGGTTWSDVWSHSEVDGDVDETNSSLDLTAAITGATSATIAFMVDGGDSDAIMSWQIDDITVLGINAQ